MAKKATGHYCGIGGQAVLEGVMMKNKDDYAVSVRKTNGDIETKVFTYVSIADKSKLFQLPFVRGVFNFIDSLVIGLRSLNFSASFFEDETAEETKADRAMEKLFGDQVESVVNAVTMLFAFVIAMALFMVLPYYLAEFLSGYVQNESLLALFEGILRIIIFLLYIIAISAMQDIKRVYMYHGAEHKCINCIERGRELTVDNVRRSSRLHKRCGTSFLLFVVLISVVVFFFIRVDDRLLRVALRILLVPVIAGISYELIRLAGRSDNAFVKALSAPGMWLQKLTTREPDDDMIEVAMKSVEAVFDWKTFLQEEFGVTADEQEVS